MANASGSGFFTLSVVTSKVVCFGSIADRHVRKGCELVGCRSAVPSVEIYNDDLSKIVDTFDDWISARTGIRRRRVLTGRDSSLTGLAVEAARKALEMAKVDPDHLDLILMCTSTPDDLFCTAPQIPIQLGCKTNPLSYDITAACSGFPLGLISSACHIRGGGFNNVLVIGANAISRYFGWTDRGSCILFGDAAGVVLVQLNCISSCGHSYQIVKLARHLNAAIRENESNNPLDSNGSIFGFPSNLSSYSCIQMNGKEVFSLCCKMCTTIN